VQTQSAALPPVERADIQTVSVPGHVTQGKFYPDPVVKQYPIRSTQLFVQAASFGNPARAEQFASTLSSIGSTHIQPAIVNGQNFYRVRIGPLRNVPEADSVLQRLASIGQNDAIVVVD
jgi:rare lipoprotein A